MSLINKFNPLLNSGIQKVPDDTGGGNKVLFDDGLFKSPNINDYAYQGVITVPADFPTSAAVLEGWWYSIAANVTDSDVTKTNTGTSWLLGDVIFWNGSTWKDFSGTIASLAVPANSVKANNTLLTTYPIDIPLAVNQVLGRLSGNIVPIDLIQTALSIGDFTGAYAGLAIEANWTNNFTNAVAGISGDLRFGTGANGTSYYAFYGQSGWNRFYSDNRVTDATLIGILQTTGNWTNPTYSVVSGTSRGDLMQVYEDSNYEYVCIDGSAKTWYRRIKISNMVTSTDITYLPKPQVVVGAADNSTFVIEAKYDITAIVVEAKTTTAGNISIGSADGLSDIVASTALPIVIGQKKQLLYLVNADYPTSSNRTLYVNIDSAATVKLHLITQKLFE